MNTSPFTPILNAQETAREGWMPEIKEADTQGDPVFDRAYFTQEVGWRDARIARINGELIAKDAEIARLKKELECSIADADNLSKAAQKVVEWRDGPEGPDMLFKQGAEMITSVRDALKGHKALTSQRR